MIGRGWDLGGSLQGDILLPVVPAVGQKFIPRPAPLMFRSDHPFPTKRIFISKTRYQIRGSTTRNASISDQGIRILFRLALIIWVILLILVLAATWGPAEPVITTVAGNGSHGFSGDGSPAVKAQLHLSASSGNCAIDRVGNLYIPDILNNVVRKVTPEGIITSRANGLVVQPSAVVVDIAGNLFIALPSPLMKAFVIRK
jgi:hypothetical protein